MGYPDTHVLTDVNSPCHVFYSQPLSMTFNCMTDAMFEPANWRAFKSFVVRVRDRAEQQANAPQWQATSSMDGDMPGAGTKPRPGRPVFA